MTYNFAGGAPCPFNAAAKQSATINFECDQTEAFISGNSHPVLVNSNQGCQYSFVWRTALACSATIVPCTFYNADEGRVYDLSPLTKPDGDYKVDDMAGNSIYTNVCKSTITPGCPAGAAACTNKFDQYKSLGQLTSQNTYNPDLHTVQSEYVGGECPSGNAKLTV